MNLVIATTNKGKLKEIQALLADAGITVQSLSEFPGCPEVVEDGKTFRANALKKARAISAFTGLPALADDSGLAVNALDGAPGVYSARYSGLGATDKKNNERLLVELRDTPDAQRGAKFVCVMALVYPDGRTKVVRGEVRGRIAHAPSGESGFGYDPLFYYRPAGMTFADMGPEAKNKVSHRARALARLKQAIGAGATV